MAAVLLLALLVPAATAGAAALGRWPVLTRFAGVIASAGALGCGLALIAWTAGAATGAPPSGSPVAVVTVGGLLRADALSAYLLAVIGAVGLTATWAGPIEDDDPRGRSYSTLIALFLGAMSLAVLADNLGVVWVAIEFTTIATAFLVGHHRTRGAIEAAWKYVMLGSVGIAIAFLGIVLLYAATRANGHPTLSWLELSAGPAGLDADLVRAATALAVLGFATKAGLAPMHSWLPDAHSQAPAPVSGLMSGVLLAVAFYAILRIRVIADAVIGPAFMRGLLTVGALASLAVAALLILRQRDYKRMLAYSSIEHMGLLALGAAVGGPLATAAVLLHVLGHGLTKAVVFVLSGRILAATGSTRIDAVRGLLQTRPQIAVPFLAGMTALLGFPPFSLFFSEVGILLAAWRSGMSLVTGAVLVLLLVVFIGLAQAVVAMTLGPAAPAPEGDATEGLSGHGGVSGPRAPIAIALGGCVLAGVVFDPASGAIARAVTALVGG